MGLRKKIRIISVLFVVLLMNMGCLSSVFASNNVLEQKSIIIMEENDIFPYADKIVKKFRIFNGVSQYRRWNVTNECWVDPYWINIS